MLIDLEEEEGEEVAPPVRVVNSDPEEEEEEEEPLPPLVYVAERLGGKAAQARTVRVKGYVGGLVKDSLRVEEGAYRLELLVADGSGELTVQAAPRLLEELLGLPPARYLQLQSTPTGRHALKAILQALPARLQRLRGLLSLEDWHLPLPRLTQVSPDLGGGAALGWELLLSL